MRELFLKSVELVDSSGAIRRFDYSVLIGEMDVGAYACESYGVKVAEQGGEQASVETSHAALPASTSSAVCWCATA